MRLGGPFVLSGVARSFRTAHADEWRARNFTDGKQIGIARISIARISDDPMAELKGLAHRLELKVHQYRYFDFKATHLLRLQGSAEERSALDALTDVYSPGEVVKEFPTPCSVGLTVICERGGISPAYPQGRRPGRLGEREDLQPGWRER
jgi:hypothetical protein